MCRPEYAAEAGVNPYWLVKQLSSFLKEDEIIFSDTGCALAWMMQGFEFKPGQRFFHAFNNTPMGYGLPGAMGASFARPGQRVICITGDGSLQMNIQELATIAHHRLPVKVLLFNNQGHSMVRQTQEQWLGRKYYSTSPEGGFGLPGDWFKIAGPDFCYRIRRGANRILSDEIIRCLSCPDSPRSSSGSMSPVISRAPDSLRR